MFSCRAYHITLEDKNHKTTHYAPNNNETRTQNPSKTTLLHEYNWYGNGPEHK